MSVIFFAFVYIIQLKSYCSDPMIAAPNSSVLVCQQDVCATVPQRPRPVTPEVAEPELVPSKIDFNFEGQDPIPHPAGMYMPPSIWDSDMHHVRVGPPQRTSEATMSHTRKDNVSS